VGKEKICILLAVYPDLRKEIERVLSSRPDLAIIGAMSDGLDLLSSLNRLSPNMVILDLSRPGLERAEAIRKMKVISPDVKVLALARTMDKEDLYQVLSAGAEGYLRREDLETDILLAADTIRGGGVYLSPVFREELTEDWVQTCRQNWALPSGLLTAREKEILKLIGQGKSSREIAGLLFISLRTAEHHRANIMNKLSMRKTADLIKYALCKGYLSATP
jgi:DNA-binding NarL/FixJ family response regulator